MKKFLFTLFCLLLVAQAVEADKKPYSGAEPLVATKDCQYLIAWQPKTDGGAEFIPGVDIHGKPVVEANITPSVVRAPEKISFVLTVDLAKYMGMTVPAGIMGEARMGMITVEKDTVHFNGKPLEGDAEAALRELCATPNPAPPAKVIDRK